MFTLLLNSQTIKASYLYLVNNNKQQYQLTLLYHLFKVNLLNLSGNIPKHLLNVKPPTSIETG